MCFAAKLLAEDDDQRLLGQDGLGEIGIAGSRMAARSLIAVGGKALNGFGLALELDGLVLAM